MKNEDFNDIYRKYHRFSVKSAYRLVKDRMLAEDISQEVFYHLYEIMDTLDLGNEEKLRALIFIATVNKTKDYFNATTSTVNVLTFDVLHAIESKPQVIATYSYSYPQTVVLDKNDILWIGFFQELAL